MIAGNIPTDSAQKSLIQPNDKWLLRMLSAVAEYIVATEMPQNSSERAWLPKLLMGILGMLSRLPFILDFSNI